MAHELYGLAGLDFLAAVQGSTHGSGVVEVLVLGGGLWRTQWRAAWAGRWSRSCKRGRVCGPENWCLCREPAVDVVFHWQRWRLDSPMLRA